MQSLKEFTPRTQSRIENFLVTDISTVVRQVDLKRLNGIIPLDRVYHFSTATDERNHLIFKIGWYNDFVKEASGFSSVIWLPISIYHGASDYTNNYFSVLKNRPDGRGGHKMFFPALKHFVAIVVHSDGPAIDTSCLGEGSTKMFVVGRKLDLPPTWKDWTAFFREKNDARIARVEQIRVNLEAAEKEAANDRDDDKVPKKGKKVDEKKVKPRKPHAGPNYSRTMIVVEPSPFDEIKVKNQHRSKIGSSSLNWGQVQDGDDYESFGIRRFMLENNRSQPSRGEMVSSAMNLNMPILSKKDERVFMTPEEFYTLCQYRLYNKLYADGLVDVVLFQHTQNCPFAAGQSLRSHTDVTSLCRQLTTMQRFSLTNPSKLPTCLCVDRREFYCDLFINQDLDDHMIAALVRHCPNITFFTPPLYQAFSSHFGLFTCIARDGKATLSGNIPRKTTNPCSFLLSNRLCLLPIEIQNFQSWFGFILFKMSFVEKSNTDRHNWVNSADFMCSVTPQGFDGEVYKENLLTYTVWVNLKKGTTRRDHDELFIINWPDVRNAVMSLVIASESESKMSSVASMCQQYANNMVNRWHWLPVSKRMSEVKLAQLLLILTTQFSATLIAQSNLSKQDLSAQIKAQEIRHWSPYRVAGSNPSSHLLAKLGRIVSGDGTYGDMNYNSSEFEGTWKRDDSFLVRLGQAIWRRYLHPKIQDAIGDRCRNALEMIFDSSMYDQNLASMWSHIYEFDIAEAERNDFGMHEPVDFPTVYLPNPDRILNLLEDEPDEGEMEDSDDPRPRNTKAKAEDVGIFSIDALAEPDKIIPGFVPSGTGKDGATWAPVKSAPDLQPPVVRSIPVDYDKDRLAKQKMMLAKLQTEKDSNAPKRLVCFDLGLETANKPKIQPVLPPTGSAATKQTEPSQPSPPSDPDPAPEGEMNSQVSSADSSPRILTIRHDESTSTQRDSGVELVRLTNNPKRLQYVSLEDLDKDPDVNSHALRAQEDYDDDYEYVFNTLSTLGFTLQSSDTDIVVFSCPPDQEWCTLACFAAVYHHERKLFNKASMFDYLRRHDVFYDELYDALQEVTMGRSTVGLSTKDYLKFMKASFPHLRVTELNYADSRAEVIKPTHLGLVVLKMWVEDRDVGHVQYAKRNTTVPNKSANFDFMSFGIPSFQIRDFPSVEGYPIEFDGNPLGATILPPKSGLIPILPEFLAATNSCFANTGGNQIEAYKQRMFSDLTSDGRHGNPENQLQTEMITTFTRLFDSTERRLFLQSRLPTAFRKSFNGYLAQLETKKKEMMEMYASWCDMGCPNKWDSVRGMKMRSTFTAFIKKEVTDLSVKIKPRSIQENASGQMHGFITWLLMTLDVEWFDKDENWFTCKSGVRAHVTHAACKTPLEIGHAFMKRNLNPGEAEFAIMGDDVAIRQVLADGKEIYIEADGSAFESAALVGMNRAEYKMTRQYAAAYFNESSSFGLFYKALYEPNLDKATFHSFYRFYSAGIVHVLANFNGELPSGKAHTLRYNSLRNLMYLIMSVGTELDIEKFAAINQQLGLKSTVLVRDGPDQLEFCSSMFVKCLTPRTKYRGFPPNTATWTLLALPLRVLNRQYSTNHEAANALSDFIGSYAQSTFGNFANAPILKGLHAYQRKAIVSKRRDLGSFREFDTAYIQYGPAAYISVMQKFSLTFSTIIEMEETLANMEPIDFIANPDALLLGPLWDFVRDYGDKDFEFTRRLKRHQDVRRGYLLYGLSSFAHQENTASAVFSATGTTLRFTSNTMNDVLATSLTKDEPHFDSPPFQDVDKILIPNTKSNVEKLTQKVMLPSDTTPTLYPTIGATRCCTAQSRVTKNEVFQSTPLSSPGGGFLAINLLSPMGTTSALARSYNVAQAVATPLLGGSIIPVNSTGGNNAGMKVFSGDSSASFPQPVGGAAYNVEKVKPALRYQALEGEEFWFVPENYNQAASNVEVYSISGTAAVGSRPMIRITRQVTSSGPIYGVIGINYHDATGGITANEQIYFQDGMWCSSPSRGTAINFSFISFTMQLNDLCPAVSFRYNFSIAFHSSDTVQLAYNALAPSGHYSNTLISYPVGLDGWDIMFCIPVAVQLVLQNNANEFVTQGSILGVVLDNMLSLGNVPSAPSLWQALTMTDYKMLITPKKEGFACSRAPLPGPLVITNLNENPLGEQIIVLEAVGTPPAGQSISTLVQVYAHYQGVARPSAAWYLTQHESPEWSAEWQAWSRAMFMSDRLSGNPVHFDRAFKVVKDVLSNKDVQHAIATVGKTAAKAVAPRASAAVGKAVTVGKDITRALSKPGTITSATNPDVAREAREAAKDIAQAKQDLKKIVVQVDNPGYKPKRPRSTTVRARPGR